jgi:hypothetical protein
MEKITYLCAIAAICFVICGIYAEANTTFDKGNVTPVNETIEDVIPNNEPAEVPTEEVQPEETIEEELDPQEQMEIREREKLEEAIVSGGDTEEEIIYEEWKPPEESEPEEIIEEVLQNETPKDDVLVPIKEPEPKKITPEPVKKEVVPEPK